MATGEAEITVLKTERVEAGLASAMAVVPFKFWRQPWLPDGHLTSTYLPCRSLQRSLSRDLYQPRQCDNTTIQYRHLRVVDSPAI